MANFSAELPTRLKPDAAIAVLAGAGISAESGLATFRGPGGLWKNHREINPEETPLTGRVHEFLQGQSGEILPARLNHLQQKFA